MTNLPLSLSDMLEKSSFDKAALESRAIASALNAVILAIPMASTWAPVNFAAAAAVNESRRLVLVEPLSVGEASALI